MAVTELEVERALTSLVDWAAARFLRCPQASFTVMTARVAMDTAIPCDRLTAAARRHLNWRSGRPRFRVEGAGAEARLT
eukprot:15474777-Alexandrium_andersonii.AAC.1